LLHEIITFLCGILEIKSLYSRIVIKAFTIEIKREFIMEQIYIISDVHGCYKTLLALIEQFLNKQNSKIVFVGDLVDKGKNTHDFIEFVKNNNYDCVLGNHDEMMILYHYHLENDIYHEDL